MFVVLRPLGRVGRRFTVLRSRLGRFVYDKAVLSITVLTV